MTTALPPAPLTASDLGIVLEERLSEGRTRLQTPTPVATGVRSLRLERSDHAPLPLRTLDGGNTTR
jgi:hypothetical protein